MWPNPQPLHALDRPRGARTLINGLNIGSQRANKRGENDLKSKKCPAHVAKASMWNPRLITEERRLSSSGPNELISVLGIRRAHSEALGALAAPVTVVMVMVPMGTAPMVAALPADEQQSNYQQPHPVFYVPRPY